MALIVQKYGGTSIGSPERIKAVAQHIEKTFKSGNQVVVVVSAMGHTTDELIALAHLVSCKPKSREMDMLLTAGERISMALLSMALDDLKVPALSLTGSQTGIITDENHCRARIQKISGSRVKDALREGKVAIVAGFQGVSESKEVTTLGRGGSDTTAVALASVLGASRCEIFTDVPGVMSADPRLVPQARVFSKITYDLMIEMSYLGAGVLHYRSVELAKQFGVRIWVKNSLKESEGTEVMDEKKGMEEYQIKGVTFDISKVLLKINLMRPTVASSIWDLSAQKHLSLFAPLFFDSKMYFYVEKNSVDEWKKSLDQLSFDGFIESFEFDSNQIPVSLVGDRFLQDGLALSQVSTILSKKEIFITHGVASPLAITLSIPLSRYEEAVKILHQHFIEGD